jgi:Lon protease-like protein
MINFIPIFPLNIVVYPGEQLNLHIFEERYKQLITESFAAAKPFGIPAVINNAISEMGTVVQITEIVKTYESGEMDIRTEGLQVFKMLEIIKQVPDKLYSGAIVNYPENNYDTHAMMQKILAAIREMHALMKVEKDFKKPDEELVSYDVAHHAGLSPEEEYELLGLLREDQRLEYLKRHLNKVMPVIAGTENLREKIKLNGHFKELKGLL